MKWTSLDKGWSQKASDKAAFEQRHKQGCHVAAAKCGAGKSERFWGTHSWRQARVEQGGGRDPCRASGGWV